METDRSFCLSTRCLPSCSFVRQPSVRDPCQPTGAAGLPAHPLFRRAPPFLSGTSNSTPGWSRRACRRARRRQSAARGCSLRRRATPPRGHSQCRQPHRAYMHVPHRKGPRRRVHACEGKGPGSGGEKRERKEWRRADDGEQMRKLSFQPAKQKQKLLQNRKRTPHHHHTPSTVFFELQRSEHGAVFEL